VIKSLCFVDRRLDRKSFSSVSGLISRSRFSRVDSLLLLPTHVAITMTDQFYDLI